LDKCSANGSGKANFLPLLLNRAMLNLEINLARKSQAKKEPSALV
jgi:hypothetical protein